ncbi:MAG: hypothetical protein WCI39_07590 [Gallionellaceae bacterium]
MKAQQTHQKQVARSFINSVEPENFVPQHLTRKALNDDSCWEECEADYDDALVTQDFSFLDDVTCN